MLRYKEANLCGDIMFVNKIPFLVTISRDIKFGTVKMIQNQKGTTIMKAIQAVAKVYQKHGFKVTNLLMDGQFKPIGGDLSMLHVNLNTVSNAEHVPEVERYIRTTKERHLRRCLHV